MSQIPTFTSRVRVPDATIDPASALAAGPAIGQALGEGAEKLGKQSIELIRHLKASKDTRESLDIRTEYTVNLSKANAEFRLDNQPGAFERFESNVKAISEDSLGKISDDNANRGQIISAIALESQAVYAGAQATMAKKDRMATNASIMAASESVGELILAGEDPSGAIANINEVMETSNSMTESDRIVRGHQLENIVNAAKVDRAKITIPDLAGSNLITEVLDQFQSPQDKFDALEPAMRAAVNAPDPRSGYDRLLQLSELRGSSVEQGKVSQMFAQVFGRIKKQNDSINIGQAIDARMPIPVKYQDETDEWFLRNHPGVASGEGTPEEFQSFLEDGQRGGRLPTWFTKPFTTILDSRPPKAGGREDQSEFFRLFQAKADQVRAMNLFSPTLAKSFLSAEQLGTVKDFFNSGADQIAMNGAINANMPFLAGSDVGATIDFLDSKDQKDSAGEFFNDNIGPIFGDGLVFSRDLSFRESRLKRSIQSRWDKRVQAIALSGDTSLEAARISAFKDVTRNVGLSDVFHTGVTNVMPERANKTPGNDLSPGRIMFDLASDVGQLAKDGTLTNMDAVPYSEWGKVQIPGGKTLRDAEVSDAMMLLSSGVMSIFSGSLITAELVSEAASQLAVGESSQLSDQEENAIFRTIGRARAGEIVATMDMLNHNDVKTRLHPIPDKAININGNRTQAYAVFVLNTEGVEQQLYTTKNGRTSPLIYSPVVSGDAKRINDQITQLMEGQRELQKTAPKLPPSEELKALKGRL